MNAPIFLLACCGALPLVLGCTLICAELGQRALDAVVTAFGCHRAVVRFIMSGQNARDAILHLESTNARLLEEAKVKNDVAFEVVYGDDGKISRIIPTRDVFPEFDKVWSERQIGWVQIVDGVIMSRFKLNEIFVGALG